MTQYTRRELLDAWLARYPDEALHPDMEFNALAGHVELKSGQFMEWGTYICAVKLKAEGKD